MSKYELTISSDYVKDWSVIQATRELFQNSLDAEALDPENKSFFHYSKDTQTLTIGNKTSVLSVDSLLLGVTTKDTDDNTVGQFGEGYKIATIVFLRTDHPITFYNYNAKEIWTTKLVKSKKYGGKFIPTFYVEHISDLSNLHNGLVIKIENITEDEYRDIENSILSLQSDLGTVLYSHRGRILLEEKYKGKVFVSGLYVCYNPHLNFGYDIKPSFLKLERDRQTVADFDLVWETSHMWIEHTEDPHFQDMFFSQNPHDIRYINNMSNDVINRQFFLRQKFQEKFGSDVVPVYNQTQLEDVQSNGGKPILVSEFVFDTVKSIYTEFMVNYQKQSKPNCYKELQNWFYTLNTYTTIPPMFKHSFETILEKYKDILKG